ncbi:MAG: hypothetical protein CMM31_10170, partial [Rhodospirillaceae bacterium]|nr:hypothetical protein [Rhodospirillaceae bacterium]
AAVSDALIDASAIAGTPAEGRARLREYRASGIDVPILFPAASAPGAKEMLEQIVRGCAPASS